VLEHDPAAVGHGLAVGQRVGVRRQRGQEARHHVVRGLAPRDGRAVTGHQRRVLLGMGSGVLLVGQPDAVRPDVELAQAAVEDRIQPGLGGEHGGRAGGAGEVGGPHRHR
jgi:hypothetical protein